MRSGERNNLCYSDYADYHRTGIFNISSDPNVRIFCDEIGSVTHKSHGLKNVTLQWSSNGQPVENPVYFL